MAILGQGGRLVLKRETPEPETVTPATRNAATNSFQLNSSTIWPGDRVLLTAPEGLPFISKANQTTNPGGHGIWGGTPWSFSHGYYGIKSTAPFWDSAPAFPWADPVAAEPSRSVYAYVDQLSRIRFYTNWADAVNGDPAKALPTGSVDFKTMTIAVQDAQWEQVAFIKNWSLELDAPSVDTTGIGTKFGEAVKSLVTAGGEIGYLVERRGEAGYQDPTILLRLLMLTERGCKATAQFWMIEGRDAVQCSNILPGDIYYETDMLVVGSSLNTAADELVGGAARFVTTGAIKLKLGV